MTDLIEQTILTRISELTRFITWVEVVLWDDTPDAKTGGDLLYHLRQELATEQANLRRLQWEREGRVYNGGPIKARVTLDTGEPWPDSIGEMVGK